MVLGLEKLFRRNNPEADSSNDDDNREPENPFEGKSKWRTTPEPEHVLGKDQQEAIATVRDLMKTIISGLEEEKESRKTVGRGLPIHYAKLLDGFSGFFTVLEHGQQEQKIAAAVNALVGAANFYNDNLESEQRRLAKFQEGLTGDQLSPEALAILQDIGNKIKYFEGGIATCYKAKQALTGRT